MKPIRLITLLAVAVAQTAAAFNFNGIEAGDTRAELSEDRALTFTPFNGQIEDYVGSHFQNLIFKPEIFEIGNHGFKGIEAMLGLFHDDELLAVVIHYVKPPNADVARRLQLAILRKYESPNYERFDKISKTRNYLPKNFNNEWKDGRDHYVIDYVEDRQRALVFLMADTGRIEDAMEAAAEEAVEGYTF